MYRSRSRQVPADGPHDVSLTLVRCRWAPLTTGDSATHTTRTRNECMSLCVNRVDQVNSLHLPNSSIFSRLTQMMHLLQVCVASLRSSERLEGRAPSQVESCLFILRETLSVQDTKRIQISNFSTKTMSLVTTGRRKYHTDISGNIYLLLLFNLALPCGKSRANEGAQR